MGTPAGFVSSLCSVIKSFYSNDVPGAADIHSNLVKYCAANLKALVKNDAFVEMMETTKLGAHVAMNLASR